MKTFVCALTVSFLLCGLVVAADAEKTSPSLDAAVETYEHLATVLIEIKKTEDGVVKSIITHHYQWAQEHLTHAQGGKDVVKHLEAAAAQITNVANEGDKRVQAIRQRLAKAGVNHISDADTKEDYLFVNSKEKKALLESAKAIAQLVDKATPAQIGEASKKLEDLFAKAVAPE